MYFLRACVYDANEQEKKNNTYKLLIHTCICTCNDKVNEFVDGRRARYYTANGTGGAEGRARWIRAEEVDIGTYIYYYVRVRPK